MSSLATSLGSLNTSIATARSPMTVNASEGMVCVPPDRPAANPVLAKIA